LEENIPTPQGLPVDVKWQVVHLKAQDDLCVYNNLFSKFSSQIFFSSYMQPGARHYVVTLDDCLAVGGHFYNRDNFDRTAVNIVYQHFLGVSISNTEHSDAVFVLMKLVHQYHKLYQQKGEWAEKMKKGKFHSTFPLTSG
jgi:hypothetical protein